MASSCNVTPGAWSDAMTARLPSRNQTSAGVPPDSRSPVTAPREWVTADGTYYTGPDPRRFAGDIGLLPLTTPVESPQSNGMAEAFVRTFKRDYFSVGPKPNAETVMR